MSEEDNPTVVPLPTEGYGERGFFSSIDADSFFTDLLVAPFFAIPVPPPPEVLFTERRLGFFMRAPSETCGI